MKMSKMKKLYVHSTRVMGHHLTNILAYISGLTIVRNRVIKDLSELGIQIIDYKVLSYNNWHNGTSTFVVRSKEGQKFFLKCSKNRRTIENEKCSIEYLKKSDTYGLFKTCDLVLCRIDNNGGYIVESFIEGTPLSNSKLVNSMDIDKKIMVLNRLSQIVDGFYANTFVHSDFTPKNIIIYNDEIYLIDFEFSYIPNVDLSPIVLRKEKIKDIGSRFSMGNGIADDGFSLMQISKYLIPDLIKMDHEMWGKINMKIGRIQFDLISQRIINK